MTPLTNAFTMLVNAAPMTTAIARSITLPRNRKTLKPSNRPTFFFTPASESSSACAVGGTNCSATYGSTRQNHPIHVFWPVT